MTFKKNKWEWSIKCMISIFELWMIWLISSGAARFQVQRSEDERSEKSYEKMFFRCKMCQLGTRRCRSYDKKGLSKENLMPNLAKSREFLGKEFFRQNAMSHYIEGFWKEKLMPNVSKSQEKQEKSFFPAKCNVTLYEHIFDVKFVTSLFHSNSKVCYCVAS